MRTLILLRHAKSSWDDWSLDDFDRPLNQRGKEAAPLVGDYLRQQDIIPDKILCSPSLRTIQTLHLAFPDSENTAQIRSPRSLFHADSLTLLALIQNTDKPCKCLCILAHNPGLHDLAQHLASQSPDNKTRQKLEKKFPTAALAIFKITDNWKDAGPEHCQLEQFTTPKMLKKQAAIPSS